MGFDGHTQTAYANAIFMNLLDSTHTLKAAKWLNELVVKNGNKLTTGFLGVRPMLPALSNDRVTAKRPTGCCSKKSIHRGVLRLPTGPIPFGNAGTVSRAKAAFLPA
jgi:hypothetical protein